MENIKGDTYGNTQLEKKIFTDSQGTTSKPYPSAEELYKFLLWDNPERYVFRGQTKEYPGPILASGIRDFFQPAYGHKAHSNWAGVIFRDDAEKLKRQRVADMIPRVDPQKPSPSDKTAWTIPESEYQAGFRRFFNQAFVPFHRALGALLRGGGNLGLEALFGPDLSFLLSQQYGLTSLGLDASTDPRIALFFATHEYPYYDPVCPSGNIGVVYRWPRGNAVVAKDVLLPLEHDSFVDTTTSFQKFLESSPNLWMDPSDLGCLREGNNEYQYLINVQCKGWKSDLSRLLFPRGAYEQSRMGRQKTALLRPHYKTIPMLLDVLVGDLLTTHIGEAFYFHHTGDLSFLKGLNKFTLWPSLRAPKIQIFRSGRRNERISVKHIQFRDIYLEFMLRFCCGCSPLIINTLRFVPKGYPGAIPLPLRLGEKPLSLLPLGCTQGVIDLGFRIHPHEARMLVNMLIENGSDTQLSDVSSDIEASNPAFTVPFARYVDHDKLRDYEHELHKAFEDILLR